MSDTEELEAKIRQLERFIKRTGVMAACVSEIAVSGCEVDKALARKAVADFNTWKPAND